MSYLARLLAVIILVGLALPPAARATSDLSIAMQESRDPVSVGRPLTYALAVSNRGPDAAGGVAALVSLPRNADLLRATSSRGGCTTGPTPTCEIGALEPGGSAALIVTIRPRAPGRLASVAAVGAAGNDDPERENDSALAVTYARLNPGPCARKRVGTRRNDVLVGGAGTDCLSGRPGHDGLGGGAGSDRLSGAEGDDRLLGENGHDRLLGGTEHDWLSGGDGADVLGGGPGEDELDGGEGEDWLAGHDDADRILGGPDGDAESGGAGQDELDGGPGPDTIAGGAGVDEAVGGPGPDHISGAEAVNAGEGDDQISVGDATVDCGPGNDTVRLRGTALLTDCERVISETPQARVLTPPPPPDPTGRPSPPPAAALPGRSRRRRYCRRLRCKHGGGTARTVSIGIASAPRGRAPERTR